MRPPNAWHAAWARTPRTMAVAPALCVPLGGHAAEGTHAAAPRQRFTTSKQHLHVKW